MVTRILAKHGLQINVLVKALQAGYEIQLSSRNRNARGEVVSWGSNVSTLVAYAGFTKHGKIAHDLKIFKLTIQMLRRRSRAFCVVTFLLHLD